MKYVLSFHANFNYAKQTYSRHGSAKAITRWEIGGWLHEPTWPFLVELL